MTTRTLLKASALALVAFAPSGAEAGSGKDVGARMQALENQIASLSAQVQRLQAPPAISKADNSMVAPKTIPSTRGTAKSTAGVESSMSPRAVEAELEFEKARAEYMKAREAAAADRKAAREAAIAARSASSDIKAELSREELLSPREALEAHREEALATRAANKRDNGGSADKTGSDIEARRAAREASAAERKAARKAAASTRAAEREAKPDTAPRDEAKAARKAAQAEALKAAAPQPRRTAKNVNARGIVADKLKALGHTVELNQRGAATFEYEGATINLHVPAKGDRLYAFATVGNVAGVKASDQHRMMQAVIDAQGLKMDALTIDPETNAVSFSTMGSATEFAGKSNEQATQLLKSFAAMVPKLQQEFAAQM